MSVDLGVLQRQSPVSCKLWCVFSVPSVPEDTVQGCGSQPATFAYDPAALGRCFFSSENLVSPLGSRLSLVSVVQCAQTSVVSAGLTMTPICKVCGGM